KNSARFLHYLDAIEPFSEPELTAFVEESGLAGVRILRENSSPVSGPAAWMADQSCFAADQLVYRETVKTYLLSYFPEKEPLTIDNPHCIIVGIASAGLDKVKEDLSIEKLLGILNKLPGIAYVTFEPEVDGKTRGSEKMIWLDQEGRTVSKHEMRVGKNLLVVALEAEHFRKRISQMRKELVLFVLFLTVIGSFISWWLYRSQRFRLEQARHFERQMAKQHEEAALGRASSTIAHELRNPLNAIGIGLQRLQFEADVLSDEHRHLLTAMREAVSRSNGVINRLRQYIHEFEIERKRVTLSELIAHGVDLYRKKCDEQSISISMELDAAALIKGDYDLLGQLLENLLRNALEAQPDGGYLFIRLDKKEQFWRLTMSNGGYSLSSDQGQKLFEPYFTTKAKGTGLGLSISRKIVEAHQGTIEWRGDTQDNEFTLVILLPGLTVDA
ncbi:MAG: GHKL domain-containing protein, partial [Deltaproteobacteria bacterium]|nr:GHKL domain-containing protein [Deltaproteobacteria bacterium]